MRFGQLGICCRNCTMGPCRITKKSSEGVCGATVDTIAARNLLRSLLSGRQRTPITARNRPCLALAAEGRSNAYKTGGARNSVNSPRVRHCRDAAVTRKSPASWQRSSLRNSASRRERSPTFAAPPEQQRKNWAAGA